MLALLTNLLSKNTPFVWPSYCQAVFTCVRKLICSVSVLAVPDFENHFKIHVGASEIGAGALLPQEG